MKYGNKTTLYLYVSKDKYELPLGVFDTSKELADFAGVTRSAVDSTISRNFKNTRFRKVVIENERE